MKEKLLRIWLLLIFGCFVASCSKGSLFSLYNHTSDDCEVITGKRVTRLTAGSEWTFSPDGDFSIVKDGQTNSYRIAMFRIPREFLDPRNPEGVIKLQLEPDGRIFLLPATNTFPVVELPPQPEGMPLNPK